MIVVFVLDTSVSMNQRATGGLTLLDCAKSAAEHFIKVRPAPPCRGAGLRECARPDGNPRGGQVRQRDPANRSDVYALVTCEDGPAAVKAFDRRARPPRRRPAQPAGPEQAREPPRHAGTPGRASWRRSRARPHAT